MVKRSMSIGNINVDQHTNVKYIIEAQSWLAQYIIHHN